MKINQHSEGFYAPPLFNNNSNLKVMKTKEYYADQVRRSIESFVKVAKGEFDYIYENADHGTIDYLIFLDLVKAITEFRNADPDAFADCLKKHFQAFRFSEKEIAQCNSGNKDAFVKAWNRSNKKNHGIEVPLTPSMVSFAETHGGEHYAIVHAFDREYPIWYESERDEF